MLLLYFITGHFSLLPMLFLLFFLSSSISYFRFILIFSSVLPRISRHIRRYFDVFQKKSETFARPRRFFVIEFSADRYNS